MYIDLIIFLALLGLGYGFGSWAERSHFKSIIRREKELSDILSFSTRNLPPTKVNPEVTLVGGSVVISIDYFKRFVAGLRQIFGGRVNAYETLIERARREAILRMKEEARELGAKAVFNVKLETSSITKGNNQNQVGCVEVYAYGTALLPPGKKIPSAATATAHGIQQS